MAHVVAGQFVINDLCKAFHIDSTKLRKIVITAQYNDVVIVEVTRLLTDDYTIEEISNKYILSEMPEEQKEIPKIAATYLFPNGMVSTCDDKGQQIPGFQGPYSKSLHKHLLKYADENTVWNGFPSILDI